MARKLLKKFGGDVPAGFTEREASLANAGIDPQLVAMLAKKKKQGELTAKPKKVPQREPQASALSPGGRPIDPRQRAAMLMQQKIQSGLEEASGRKKKKKKKKTPSYNV